MDLEDLSVIIWIEKGRHCSSERELCAKVTRGLMGELGLGPHCWLHIPCAPLHFPALGLGLDDEVWPMGSQQKCTNVDMKQMHVVLSHWDFGGISLLRHKLTSSDLHTNQFAKRLRKDDSLKWWNISPKRWYLLLRGRQYSQQFYDQLLAIGMMVCLSYPLLIICVIWGQFT